MIILVVESKLYVEYKSKNRTLKFKKINVFELSSVELLTLPLVGSGWTAEGSAGISHVRSLLRTPRTLQEYNRVFDLFHYVERTF